MLLMGPTGAGKTAVAIELAAGLPAEIVSVDSALVYRGLDIGTAKPEAAVRAQVPHHLIDILDPAQPYSAGQFVRDAVAAVDAIQARGRIPLLTGGTMLYFHALLHGLAELPEADPELRRELDERAAREGTAALHKARYRDSIQIVFIPKKCSRPPAQQVLPQMLPSTEPRTRRGHSAGSGR